MTARPLRRIEASRREAGGRNKIQLCVLLVEIEIELKIIAIAEIFNSFVLLRNKLRNKNEV